MEDITVSPEVMQAQLNELVRDMLRLQPRHEEVTVRDPEGQIAATYGADGQLARVLVEPRWVEKIESSELATAILTTIAEAQFQASGLSDDAPEPTQAEIDAKRAEILRNAENELDAPKTDDELQTKIDSLPGLFGQLDAALDRLNARVEEMEVPVSLAEADELGLTAEPVGEQFRSENSMVTVTVSAEGAVVDVAIHANWLDGKSGIAVTECFDQIIEQLHDHTNS